MTNEKRKLLIAISGVLGACFILNSFILYFFNSANQVHWGMPLSVGFTGLILVSIAVYAYFRR